MPMPRKADPERACQQCGARMERKVSNGRIEDRTVFSRRKYCDRACMARAFIKIDPTLAAFRVRAKKLRGATCEVCGATTGLSAHHLDENPKNNTPENVRTLCGSCHQIWHWHFGKNRKTRAS